MLSRIWTHNDYRLCTKVGLFACLTNKKPVEEYNFDKILELQNLNFSLIIAQNREETN